LTTPMPVTNSTTAELIRPYAAFISAIFSV
jgi:hypothetical protein